MAEINSRIEMHSKRLFQTKMWGVLSSHFRDQANRILGEASAYRTLIRTGDVLEELVEDSWAEPLALEVDHPEVDVQKGTFYIENWRGQNHPGLEYTGVQMRVKMKYQGSDFLWDAFPEGWAASTAIGHVTLGELTLVARAWLGTPFEDFGPRLKAELDVIQGYVAAQRAQIESYNKTRDRWARNAIKERNLEIRQLKRMTKDPFGLQPARG